MTAPGEECQFDWSEVGRWTREWGLGEVHCFQCVLCWSRARIWWFARSIDREYTFEGLVRFFERVGGVTKVCRTDRMGALGQSQGRRFTLIHPQPRSPSSMGPRSGPVRPETPRGRARWSVPSGT